MNEFAMIVGPLELVLGLVFVVSFVALAYLVGTAIGRSNAADAYRATKYAHRRLFNELAAIVEEAIDTSPAPWAVHDTLGYGYDIRGPDNEPAQPHDGAFYITNGDDGGGAFSNRSDALVCVMIRNALPRLLSLIAGENKFEWSLDDIREARMKLDATGWTFERLADEGLTAGPVFFEAAFDADDSARDASSLDARTVTLDEYMTLSPEQRKAARDKAASIIRASLDAAKPVTIRHDVRTKSKYVGETILPERKQPEPTTYVITPEAERERERAIDAVREEWRRSDVQQRGETGPNTEYDRTLQLCERIVGRILGT